MIGVRILFYFHESAESNFHTLNGHPEFKVIIPPNAETHLTMMLTDGNEVPFAFPNSKPVLNELLAENSSWSPIRISFTDAGILLIFKNRADESPDNNGDGYDTKNFAVYRPYTSFAPSPEGISFVIEVSIDGEIVEDYNFFIDDTDVLLTYETETERINRVITRSF